jgi:hypothetical protein
VGHHGYIRGCRPNARSKGALDARYNGHNGRYHGSSCDDTGTGDDTATHHGSSDDEGSDNHNDRSANDDNDTSVSRVLFCNGVTIKPLAEQRRDDLGNIQHAEFRVHGNRSLQDH